MNKVLRGRQALASPSGSSTQALEGTREKTGTDPVVTLKRALDNVKPALEVKSRRVGGATYQVPIEVSRAASDHAGAALAGHLLAGRAARRP